MARTGLHARFRRLAAAVGLAATLFSAAMFVLAARDRSGFLAQVELKTIDARFRLRGARPADPRVVLCAIDQRSLAALGRWPWPRATLARLIDGIAAGHPKVIALDIAFPLPEVNPLAALRAIPLPQGWSPDERESWLAARDGDRLLADAFARAGNVILGYYFLTSRREAEEVRDERPPDWRALLSADRMKVVRATPGGPVRGGMPRAPFAEPSLALLRRSAIGAGYFNAFPDADGTTRGVQLLIAADGDLYPYLGLVAAARSRGVDITTVPVRVAEYGLEPLEVAGRRLPQDDSGRVWLNYRGPAGTFRHVPAVDVIRGEADADAFADRIVFVGATAVGIGDRAVTPFGQQEFPGTEVHATFADNFLAGDFLRRPSWLPGVELATILALGLAVTLATARLGPLGAPAFAAASLAAVWISAQILFSSQRVLVGLVFPSLVVPAVFVPVFVVRMLTEVRARNQIKRAFSRYLHPQVVERIAADPESIVLGGESRAVTVLFSDIRSFTAVCAGTEPQEMIRRLNDYLDRMTRIILDHGGLVDKYIGDAIMAFWGAPERQEDHVDRALACAARMIEGVAEMNRAWAAQGRAGFAIRIGIATGQAVVGNVGSKNRLDYTAIGDCVNLAARLEQAGKRHAGPVLVDEDVVRAARGSFVFQERAREALIEGLGPRGIFALDVPGRPSG